MASPIDPAVTARVSRIKELMTKGSKATAAEQAELKKLMADQMAWEKANPDKASLLRDVSAIAAKTPEQMKAEYDAALAAASTPDHRGREDAASSGIESAPKPGSDEEQRTAAGQRARAEAIAAGKPVAVADAIALEAYRSWKPAAPAAVKPGEDSFSQHYTAMGEALTEDYRDFAKYLRGLADKGELKDASGKPLPMYSAEQIENLSLEQLKALAAGNPRYASTFFKAPDPETAKALEGTGRTGVGQRSGMVEIPAIPSGPAPTAAPAPAKPEAPAAEPVAEKPAEPEIPPSEATMVGAGGGATSSETPKKKKFGEVVGDLYKRFGVPALEILQAVGYQRGGINKPTVLDQKYQEKLSQQEKDYQKKLEEERAAREEATYQKRIAEQREWESKQAELARLADKEARGEELTMREKIARMELSARQAAAKATGAPAPIIPE